MKIIFSLAFVFLCSICGKAQHCPYDGTRMIAIKVVDKQGKMLTDINTAFYLQEVDNTMADSCPYATGLIKKQFLSTKGFIADCDQKFNRNGYNNELNDRLKYCGVFTNANIMLSINQAENTCMLIGKSETVYTNYIYRQRKFVITYSINGKEMQQPLPNDLIYSLCTNNKELKNFKTLTIKL
jgi:hypothetical protein